MDSTAHTHSTGEDVQEVKTSNKGDGLLEVRAHEALHGGTARLAEPYSVAIPVEKIATPLPGVTTESGTSRLAPNYNT